MFFLLTFSFSLSFVVFSIPWQPGAVLTDAVAWLQAEAETASFEVRVFGLTVPGVSLVAAQPVVPGISLLPEPAEADSAGLRDENSIRDSARKTKIFWPVQAPGCLAGGTDSPLNTPLGLGLCACPFGGRKFPLDFGNIFVRDAGLGGVTALDCS